jgi:phospholipase C
VDGEVAVKRRYLALVVIVILSLVFATATAAGAHGGHHHLSQTHGIDKIDHVVVLMQENRSYDSYFGPLHFQGQPNSAREPNRPNPNPLGGPPIHPFLTTTPCTTADLNHSWDGTHDEIDGGRMDGFTAQNTDPTDPTGSRTMSHYDRTTLPFYYGIANEFSIADRYFASVPGPTFPNRFYLLTGTSVGFIDNVTKVYTQKPIFQSLDEATPPVSWKIYLASLQVELLLKYVQNHSAGHVFPLSQYFTDAAAGNLPQVSFVESDPFGDVNHESDEHPPANVQVGQKFTHDLLSALVASPNWASSAMFLTYDEHGGYYDHVSPPAAVPPDDIPPMVPPGDPFNQFNRYGVRVPALVMSPYSNPHHVSHVVYDHTSILKFIETRFGLPPLTRRDAAADPMLDMFDFHHASVLHPKIPDSPVDPVGLFACKVLHP